MGTRAEDNAHTLNINMTVDGEVKLTTQDSQSPSKPVVNGMSYT